MCSRVVLVCLLSLLAISVHAGQKGFDGSCQLAFPGAEGWGNCSTGGRGGTVFRVINLNPTGAGSLHACLTASVPRICVFDISGTIDMPGRVDIDDGNITIAGNTAPYPGIMIKGAFLAFRNDIGAGTGGDHVMVRYLRVRAGLDIGAFAKSSFKNISPNAGANGIFDHNSVGWATDDQLGVIDSDLTTFSWNLDAEGLQDPSGRGLILDNSLRSSVIKNALFHFPDRVPQIPGGFGATGADVQVVNNLMYNADGNANVFPTDGEIRVEFIKNYFRPGPRTRNESMYNTIWTLGCGHTSVDCTEAAASSIYLLDNIHTVLRPANTGNQDTLVIHNETPITITTTKPNFPIIDQVDAFTARDHVLAYAGASICDWDQPCRDSLDYRYVREFNTGTGLTGGITDPAQVGGYPTYASNSRPAGYDMDGDGMPNHLERRCGFNPAVADATSQDSDGDGWTDLEEMIWPEGNPRHSVNHGTTITRVRTCKDRLNRAM